MPQLFRRGNPLSLSCPVSPPLRRDDRSKTGFVCATTRTIVVYAWPGPVRARGRSGPVELQATAVRVPFATDPIRPADEAERAIEAAEHRGDARGVCSIQHTQGGEP